jgi:hypothetical protein
VNAEELRAILQAVLDGDEPDGWQIGQFVIVVSLERINSDSGIDATPWYWAPPDQPDWMTGGLLEAALELRCQHDCDD